ncbi:hypothetical protein [Halomonas ventosae]|uniref:Uncharacterized protein n=1 Tax=Halomonas ventosae TaxID=229007 RepID=A0A2T0VRN0_9GAMM|nr:hypothetical protein [Halomonas ventosae]PRY73207.1 hypothetical protein BCL64_102288 [Halomonas ventosae]
MKESKRIQNVAAWVPPEQRQSRFGGSVGARAAESLRPLYRLISVSGDSADELYFVNETDETLRHVAAFTGGFITADDEALALQEANVVYHDVLPHEGVKVAAYDGYYDLDYVFQLSFEVSSDRQGTWRIVPPAKKGGVPAQELLWDDGSHGRRVVVEQRTPGAMT